ncbi:tail tape measure protein [Methanoculleus virus Blf4]|uniref:Tail tape measure protein n=1 Tax=Methanoculleus virus Blf4 TaxID=3070925 RepID=A0AA49AL34_9CAUD|nr:tail tape measure protein [Methanoculleus virus L4768]QXM18641.1 tail tape measure protein [Methanoculleus virus Blf4]
MVGETVAGKLVVEIVGDVAGLVKAYDEAKKRTEGLEGDLKSIGSRMTSIGSDLSLKVTAPLALAGAGMVKLASDAAETQAKFKQVFGDLTDSANEWVDEYSRAIGRARTDVQEMSATMMSIVKAMHLSDEAGMELSQTITELSVDMGAFHNVADVEAFNALRSAITGEYEPMKRFGVVINEAKVAQELLNMGITGGTKAATDAEKVQARLNIIMSATADVQGAAAREADGFANQMKALAADAKELGESFGQLLLPLAQDLISTMRGGIAWFSELDEGTKKLIVTTGLLAAATGPVIWGIGTLAGSVGSMISLYRTYQASTIAATVATRGFTAAIMANPLGLAIIGVTTLGAVLLPLIASTNDATKAQEEYNAVLRETADLTGKTTEEIEDEIDILKEREQQILANIEAIKAQNVVVDRGTNATRQATQATRWHKLATGDLTREFRDTTDAIKDGTVALGKMTQAQKDAAIAAEQQRLAENRAAQAIRDTELQTRRLADGAKVAYDQASKAVSAHQRAVSDLQKEYNELKETIDKALGIDEEIEDANREVERADIRRIRAERDLADIREEIKKKRAEAAGGDADAKRELEDLLLREREAVLNVAEAQDRYQDALDAASAKQAEKVEVEQALNGESVESAQARLEEIKKQIDEETEKLEMALAKREEAQIAHENFMALLTRDSVTYQSETWAEYVKFMDANPAYGRIYYVEHDENGNPIGGLPQPPVRDIQVPSYGSPAFAAASRSAATVAGGSDAEGGASVGGGTGTVTGAGAEATPPPAGGVSGMSVILNQNIYTQSQSATEVQAATKRGLRDGALELGL